MVNKDSYPKALEGIRVLDLGNFLGGPFCSTLLGEFGAHVIKIERPGPGDPQRHSGGAEAMYQGVNLFWAQESRNKKSITCDLRTPRGQRLMKDLVKQMDIVVENYTPGTLKKWNLDYDDLRAVNPAIIMVRVSGYGQTGPNSHKPGFARIAQAYGGFTYLAGEPGGPPLTPGSTTIADYNSGLFSAFGALVALRHRDRTGEGQVVELGLYESVFRIMDTLTVAYDKAGVVRERVGRFTPLVAPHGQFPTKDGRWIALACNTDRQFRDFLTGTGHADLADDERFSSPDSRVAHRDVLNALVEEITSQHTYAELMVIIEQAEVPGGPVNSIQDIFEDPHFWERETLVKVPDPTLGEVTMPGPIPHLSRTPGRIEHLGPVKVGEHNELIYRGLLGLSAEELQQLQAEGVI